MAVLGDFGVELGVLAAEPGCVFYSVGSEIYLFSGGLHVLVATDRLISLFKDVHVGGHYVEGHSKSSSRQGHHYVSGYWRGGSCQRRHVGYDVSYDRVEPVLVYVGPYDVCDDQVVREFDLSLVGQRVSW